MILKDQVYVEIETTDDDLDGLDYEMDDAKMGMLVQLLSQYSDIISSVVREVTSNAVDAHIEAELIPSMTDAELRDLHYTGNLSGLRQYFSAWKNQPVRVAVVEGGLFDGGAAHFEVQDFGVGLSPTRVEKVYRKFLASTKDKSNEFIGAFGLGSKSPLGYSDLFYINTVFFGTRYNYIVRVGAKVPKLVSISKEPTDDINGTTISVPIKDMDAWSFRRAVCKQLMYFDNLQIEGVEEYKEDTILHGEHFVYKEGTSEKLHICLGRVYYPLDHWQIDTLKTEMTNLPVGLKFDVGELDIIWNRETIEYKERTIAAIEAKVTALQEELQGLWDRDNTDINTIEQLLEGAGSSKDNSVTIDDVVIKNTSHWFNQDVYYAPMKQIGRFTSGDFLRYCLSLDRVVDDGRTRTNPNWPSKLKLTEMTAFIRKPGQKSDARVNEYLYYEKGLDRFYLMSFNDVEKAAKYLIMSITLTAGGKDTIKWDDHPDLQEHWKAFIIEVMRYISTFFKDYGRELVPEDWLADKAARQSFLAKKAREEKKKGRFVMPYRYYGNGVYRYSRFTGKRKWTMNEIKFDDSQQSILGRYLDASLPVVYGFNDDRADLEDLFHFVNPKGASYLPEKTVDPIRLKHGQPLFVLVSKQNRKHLMDFEHTFSVGEYRTRLRKLVTKAKTAKLIREHVKALPKAGTTAYEIVENYTYYYRKLHAYVDFYEGHNQSGYYEARVENAPLDMDIIEDLRRITALVRKYPMFSHLMQEKGRLPDHVLDEAEEYITLKGRVNPLLLMRLAEHRKKNQTAN